MSSAVVKKIETILHSPYNTKNYVDLVCEIFPDVRIVAPKKLNKEFSNFSSHIEGSAHVGTFQTPDKKRIIIMAVQLKKAGYVENARSTHRSFAKKLIENGNADAAFIAFYTEGDPKWRLSLVRLDYDMKIENGRLKTAENLTPAKRYSYLVGQDEPCHTAISQFERFITDSTANPERPTLDDLENAFSVEKVTDEFFNLYCEKFHQLREQLEAIEDFRIEAEQHNFTAAQFAKKLMGQIVFLYFLQKKGWLGVGAWPNTLSEKEYKNAFYARGAKSRELIPIVYRPVGDGTYRISSAGLNSISDADEEVLANCVKGKPWGSGPHDFMRKLFNLAIQRKVNFYNDLLEPLFYDALNRNRGEQGYCPALHCRIPFLSGGLFEPIDGYDWEHNDFSIPNEVFSNVAEKGRDADGILDIFDRYNFTMSEDEPMEREVAIDPEMLGKVFENLLEINDRKSKGAFYTPREIVHYMCQESLINYLTNTLNISEEAIRDFILYGDFMKDEDTVKEKRQGNGGMYISEELYKINSDGTVAVNRLLDMDTALKDVRVADPAVGSGAFPLGMLNEIVRARQNISAYLAITMKPYDVRMMYQMERSPHTLKYETIRNCIFACDIEPSAVDIAQLRLWLALVIDDEINPSAQTPLDGHRNPLPLPNLESNILCGNSLLDSFEGQRLIKESDLTGSTEEYQVDFGHARFDTVLKRLIDAQDELFRCDEPEKKRQLIEKIHSLRDVIIAEQLSGCDEDMLRRYRDSTKAASKPYVLWQLDFARVFREKGGFDIVIGNPPYIQLQKTINEETGEKLGEQYESSGFATFAKTGDIYCLFYEKGQSLLRYNGVLAFITSNKWMRAGYGEKLRAFFAKETNPLILIDLAGQKVFESATVDVNILIFTKAANCHHTLACNAKDACLSNLSVFVERDSAIMTFAGNSSWTILSNVEQNIKHKIDAIGIPLKKWSVSINYGIKTGFNEAFIITGAKKDELIAADPKSVEIIRPILRGRDIKRYGYSYADLWLISTFPSRKYDIDCYPAIKKHLLSFGIERLEQTGKKHIVNGKAVNARKKTNNAWFETQDSISYWDDFSKQKIVYAETMRVHRNDKADRFPRFSFIEQEAFLDKTCFMITGEHLLYILPIINSALMQYHIQRNIAVLDTGGFLMQKIYIEDFPIPPIEKESYKILTELAAEILSNRAIGKDTRSLEELVDLQVYSLFDLNEAEIRYIEASRIGGT